MTTLHVNFFELPQKTQEVLRKIITTHCLNVNKRASAKALKDSTTVLFDTNNAGIDIDIYDWMDELNP